MTITELFEPIIKIVHRYMIRHELATIKYHRSLIQSRRDNDFYVERLLDRREVLLRSKLNGL